jgi:hypothetical protein
LPDYTLKSDPALPGRLAQSLRDKQYVRIMSIGSKIRRNKGVVMTKHSHRFVETLDGLLGYGLDRQTNEDTLEVYLQKFSDDDLMKTILKRMTDDDLDEVFDVVSKMLKRHLNEPEYHQLFLKEEV